MHLEKKKNMPTPYFEVPSVDHRIVQVAYLTENMMTAPAKSRFSSPIHRVTLSGEFRTANPTTENMAGSERKRVLRHDTSEIVHIFAWMGLGTNGEATRQPQQ